MPRISAQARLQITALGRAEENIFPIDSDWWWVWERRYRPSQNTQIIVPLDINTGVTRNWSEQEINNRIRTHNSETSNPPYTYTWSTLRGTNHANFNFEDFTLEDELDSISENTTMPNQSPVAARSLLYLLKRLKKESTELLAKPEALFWKWFSQTIRKIADSPKFFNNNGTHVRTRKYQVLERVGQITGVYLIPDNENTYKFHLKSECKTYWRTDRLEWVHQTLWESYKSTGYLVWAPDIKDWVLSEALLDIKTPSGKVITRTWVPHTKHKYKKCPYCEGWWEKENITYNKFVEENICPACHKQNQNYPKNDPHDFRSIFGNYHSHSNWTFYNQRLYNGDEKELPIGIEIEMNINNGNKNILGPKAWELYQFQIKHNPNWHNFYCEMDGSLSSSGIELITNPMTLSYHHEYWEVMLPKIREDFVGWNAKNFGGVSYGIHLTFHQKYWSDYHLARLLKFSEALSNQNFIYAIAQRRNLYGGKDIARHSNPQLKEVAVIQEKKLHSTERAQSVYIKGNGLVEIRMFASTLNQESFLKNIEFVSSFHQWCKETAFSVDYRMYLKWLFNSYAHEKMYPNLWNYVQKKKFGCKNGAPVINEWQDCLKHRPLGQLDLFGQTVNDITEDRQECV